MTVHVPKTCRRLCPSPRFPVDSLSGTWPLVWHLTLCLPRACRKAGGLQAEKLLTKLAHTVHAVHKVHQFAGGINIGTDDTFLELNELTKHYAQAVDPRFLRATKFAK